MSTNEICKKDATKLIEILEKHGFQGYFVGGCVRDMVMGRIYNDIDIATSAPPYKTKEIFLSSGYNVYLTGIKHGTVGVLYNGNMYEITTYRIDGSYADSRHPDSVEFTNDIFLDLSRRDFTVNAMAMDREGNIVDPFGGRADIENKIIRCVGNGEERFSEDALRIMRAVRFASVLGFDIHPEALKAMRACGSKITNVAGERIFTELKKMLLADGFENILYSCADIIEWSLYPHGFTKKLMDYNREDVLKTLSCLKKDFVVIICGIICLCGRDKNTSSDMADNFIERMKMDKNTANSISCVTKAVFERLPDKKCMINRQMLKLGCDNFYAVFEIKKMMGKFGILTIDQDLEEKLEIYNEIMSNGGCVHLSDVAVNGNDLYSIGIEKSPKVGRILNLLLDEVVEGRVNNTKEELLDYVKGIVV